MGNPCKCDCGYLGNTITSSCLDDQYKIKLKEHPLLGASRADVEHRSRADISVVLNIKPYKSGIGFTLLKTGRSYVFCPMIMRTLGKGQSHDLQSPLSKYAAYLHF